MIVTDKDLLKQVSTDCVDIKEVADIDNSLREEFKQQNNAIGLSAVQIGILKRIFILYTEDEGLITFVHPKIIESSEHKIKTIEGCLSFPDVKVLTYRPYKIEVTDATEKHRILKGIESIAFQHELDHLDGVLFMERGSIVESPVERNEKCFCGSNKKFKKCCGK
jgi:peptide deformylase